MRKELELTVQVLTNPEQKILATVTEQKIKKALPSSGKIEDFRNLFLLFHQTQKKIAHVVDYPFGAEPNEKASSMHSQWSFLLKQIVYSTSTRHQNFGRTA